MAQAVKDRVQRALQMLGTTTLFSILFVQVADAGYPPIYDVEIIVFLNNKGDTDGESLKIPGINNPSNYGRAFPEGEFTELAYKFYQLKSITESLEQSSDYNVLYHRAWRQLAYNSNNAVPYPLDSVADSENNSVTGSVKLKLENDLYLDVAVLLMSSNIPSDSSTGRPVQQLMEKQRIKSDQIYYFNHPYLSMIAKVTPYRKNGNGTGGNSEEISFLRQQLALR